LHHCYIFYIADGDRGKAMFSAAAGLRAFLEDPGLFKYVAAGGNDVDALRFHLVECAGIIDLQALALAVYRDALADGAADVNIGTNQLKLKSSLIAAACGVPMMPAGSPTSLADLILDQVKQKYRGKKGDQCEALLGDGFV